MYHALSNTRTRLPVFLALLCVPLFAQAADPVQFSAAPLSAFAPAAAPVDAPKSVDGMGATVATDSLGELRGGESESTQIVDITGGVDGNTAVGTTAGDNVLQNGAFANSAGISTVIQNSGANVLIQNGMVVNVQFGAGP